MMPNKRNVCQLTDDDEQPTRKIIDFYKKIVHNRLKMHLINNSLMIYK